MKSINKFTDSSDDEDIVETNPYNNLTTSSDVENKSHLTLKRLKNILQHEEIRGKSPQPHQFLMHNPAIKGRKKKGGINKSASHFPAPLVAVKAMLDAVPSSTMPEVNSIVPSFRGLTWQSNMPCDDVFFSTRVHWEGEYNYASQAFILSQVDIQQHTRAFFKKEGFLLEKYNGYDLSSLDTLVGDDLQNNNDKLKSAAVELKQLFKLADVVKKPFAQWKVIFGKLRNAKALNSPKNSSSALSLSQILSYIYVNGYAEFKNVLTNLDTIINKLNDNDKGVLPLKTFIKQLSQPTALLAEGMPYLSEGQIPRHSLLYAFGLKVYTQSNALNAEALYTQNIPKN